MQRIDIEDRMLLLGLSGSQAYGTALPTSDIEYKGICMGDRFHYFGFTQFEQKDKGWAAEEGNSDFPMLDTAPDSVVYELRKFFRLAMSANPNILEMLWLEPDQYVYLTDVGRKLIQCRSMFLSKKVKSSYLGYAHAQVKRIESHRRWLLSPPNAKPTLAQFGLDENTNLSKSDLHAFLEFLVLLIRDRIEWIEQYEEVQRLLKDEIDFKSLLVHHSLPNVVLGQVQHLTRCSGDFISVLQKAQSYRQATKDWEAYQSWLKNRNPERAALEAKTGFDSKNASHAIRLMRTGLEILRAGEILVNRVKAGDAQELLAIRQGERSYEWVKSEMASLALQINEAMTASSLPNQVDHNALNNLCVTLIKRWV